MSNRLKIMGMALTLATGATIHGAPGDDAPQQQTLLSRLRRGGNAEQQAPAAQPVQLAQNRGYQPGVTIPQQQQRAQQQAPPQQQIQQPYPAQQQAYPPQPVAPPPGVAPGQPAPPYNMQAPQRTPTSGATAQQQQQQQQSGSAGATQRSSRSSEGESKSSSRSSSGSSSSKKTSSDDAKKTSAKSSEGSKSSESNAPSALQKIARKVESDSSDSESAGKKAAEKAPEKTPVPKKSDEEVAREKAHAAFLKAADDATTVVAGFLKQANDGYYSKASESLSPAIQKYFNSEISAVNGTEKAVLDELTANGTITMVTYINTTVRGEGAVVEAELGYADGRNTRRAFDLIKIDNKWKIVLPVTDQTNNASAAPAAAPQAAPATPPAVPGPISNPGSLQQSPDGAAPLPTAEQAASQAAPGADGATTAPAAPN